KPIVYAVFFTFFLTACGGGGGGGGNPVPTVEGTALIPGGGAIPKTGFSKTLPGTGAFINSKVRARSLSTGVSYDSTGTVGSDGTFRIEDIPFGDDYLLMARKGNQVVSKFVTIPANVSSPFSIGKINLASTATVQRVERIVQDAFPNREIKFQPGDTHIYDIDIINEIWFEKPDELTTNLSELVAAAMDDSGRIYGSDKLNPIFKENGEISSEKIANINIYLTLYQVLLGGNPDEDESLPDVITNYINGNGNIIADQVVINNIGDVTNTNVTVPPEVFEDHFDAIFFTQTTITRGPANPTTDTSATFAFVSNKANSTFECKMDNETFGDCVDNPKTYNNLALGTHEFCVKATGPDGEVDPRAACYVWRISTDLSAGLVAFYPFNGNANDESGNGHHGTVNGAALTMDRFGNASSAYLFDGVNDFIEIPYSSALHPSVFSLSVWFKSTDPNRGTLITSDPNSFFCNHGFELGLFNGKGWFNTDPSSGCGDGTVVKSNRLINDGNWHHMIAVFDGLKMELYLDGALEAQRLSTSSYSKPNSFLRLGMTRRTDRGDQRIYFGTIDDVRIYNRALSAAEIADLAAQRPDPVLTVSRTGGGTVTSNPTGIDCGADC
ncbi:MAG: LamG domain-containing protein, partial [Nitrospiria bacterium]